MTRREELEQRLEVLRRVTGRDDLEVSSAYGQPRIEGKGGAEEVSPRLAHAALLRWIEAAIVGAVLRGRP